MPVQDPSQSPIAIVGVSAIFPGSLSATGFWKDILRGTDLIGEVPASHWLKEDYYDPDPAAPDKTYAHRGGFLSDVGFDPMEWGVPPSILQATDTTQLLALIVAKRVLQDAANGDFDTMDRDRISCILGVTSAQELLGTMNSRLQRPVWKQSLRELGYAEEEVELICERIASKYAPWQESSFPGLLGNVVAGRIANRLNLGGTNCVTDAACASSFSAMAMAMNELWLGHSDLVITGGADTMNDIFMYMCFSKTPALSKSGECRPFSDQADGTLLGEGLGMVALKRLEDAERDGDPIYAVVRGIGSSSDGRSKSVYAPVPGGQAKALRRAYGLAGYGMDTVELVEAHGTGTKAGDAAEFAGLQLAFDESGKQDRQWCALGTVKSQIGHTKAAAGAAGLFKVVMALQHKVLPPTIKIDQPNPNLEIDKSPFYLNTQARPWIRDGSHPRRASVSSFGFGGSNFHVALEEYTGKGESAKRRRTAETEAVVLSADTPQALSALAREWAGQAKAEGFLLYAGRASQLSFDASKPARMGVVASTDIDLAQKLTQVADHIDRNAGTPLRLPTGLYYANGGVAGDVALLFPGQGSQYLHMGAELAMTYDTARNVWDRTADLPFGDTALHRVVYPQPTFDDLAETKNADTLRATEWAQPAIGATSLAQLALLDDIGVKAQAVGGHSYGEITALCAAGALSPTDALRVARRRGELMAEAAVTDGTMIAVPATIDVVKPYVANVEGAVIANHNGPSQVVVSGPTQAVEAVDAALRADGIEPKKLHVATAFHSPVVADSVEPFRAFLDDISVKKPKIPTWHNATADKHKTTAKAIRDALGSAIAKPVRFVEQIESMYAAGVRTFIEVGPSQVLTRLTADILADKEHVAVSLDRRGMDSVTAFQHGLCGMVTAGIAVDFVPLWDGFRAVENPHERTQPRLSIPVNGSNLQKPYPPENGAAGLAEPNPVRTGEALQFGPEPQVIENVVERVVEVPVAAAPQPTTPSGGSMTQPSDPNAPQDPWLAAFLEAQRATVGAHAAYQHAMAESHAQFLRTVEASMGGLTSLLGGQPMPAAAPSPYTPVSSAAFGSVGAAPQELPHWTPPATERSGNVNGAHLVQSGSEYFAQTRQPVAVPAPAPVVAAPAPPAAAAPPPVAATPAVPVAAAPAAATPAPSGAVDLEALMLEVVAEKTGYPSDMLALHMKLEADLGVDSIKRVEILSAVRERAPGLPEVDANAMAALQTLGQVVDYLRSVDPSQASAPATAPTPEPAAETPTNGASGELDLEALMLDVVAEKTGYPADMLAMEMKLEADLGVDSIKRVEILSSVRERAPGMPEVDANAMAALQTLGQVVDHLREITGGASPKSESAASTSDAVDLPPLGRWTLKAVPAPAAGMSMPGLGPDADVAVVPTGTFANAVVKALHNEGFQAQATDTVHDSANAVVFVGGMQGKGTAGEALALHRQALVAAKAVAARFATEGGLFVTVQDTGGDFGLSGSERAWSAGLPGLVKTAAQEWSAASCKAIDIEKGKRRAPTLAKAVVEELLFGGAELEVGLRASGDRIALQSVPGAPASDTPAVDKNAVVVATGGARGVTAHTLIAWARAHGGRFVLLGRTPLQDEPAHTNGLTADADLKRALLDHAKASGTMPTPAELGKQVSSILGAREIRGTLHAIEGCGAQARYLPVDVLDTPALNDALQHVRDDWGPITALVHGAGVLADRLIADKTEEQFERVFQTKVAGLSSLLDATQKDPLTCIVNFASIAGRCGNQGQCDYAMANEVLAKVGALEQARRGDACVVKSLQWGPWEAGMVTPQLKARFASLGVPLIPLDTGAQMLVDELSDRTGSTELVLGSPPRMGPLAEAAAERSVTLRVRVGKDSHPFLAHHAIGETVVVPVVMALEWFTRTAQACRPDLHVARVRELRVLRGIQLADFGGAGDWFDVTARQVENGAGATLELSLVSLDGRPHYAAIADCSESASAAPGTPAKLKTEQWDKPDLYDGTLLFHGKDFQVIRSLDGVSDEGLVATVAGTSDSGWTGGPWYADPAAIDGAFQMMLLWYHHKYGGASLPMHVGSFRSFGPEPVGKGPLQAILHGKERTRDKTVADIVFVDAEGKVIHELRDVEAVRRPDV